MQHYQNSTTLLVRWRCARAVPISGGGATETIAVEKYKGTISLVSESAVETVAAHDMQDRVRSCAVAACDRPQAERCAKPRADACLAGVSLHATRLQKAHPRPPGRGQGRRVHLPQHDPLRRNARARSCPGNASGVVRGQAVVVPGCEFSFSAPSIAQAAALRHTARGLSPDFFSLFAMVS